MAWSSGKDSAWALHVSQRSEAFEVVGVLTTLTEPYERVSMHGVREELLDLQLAALGLPCTKVRIPSPCSNEAYQRQMADALAELRAEGVSHVIFGDLFLQDIRAYRETQLASVGMQGVFPLWQRDTEELVREMLGSGLRAVITCVDPRALSQDFAGRLLDEALLDELPDAVDPCGENGEFHSVVIAGPMLTSPIAVEVGDVVEREGFVFADVIPVEAPDAQASLLGERP
ncbi:MAG: adenine nucleotide alpha hydrolase [Deltaproteobacteria bacterium]|nr:adenine nucleotide alpha hydrolase [Deltaproteobacteria bacterium]